MKRFAFLSMMIAVPLALGVRAMQPEPARVHGKLSSKLATRPDADAIRVMSFNLAHGRRLSLHQTFLRQATIKRNLEDIGSLIRAHDPDVVAAQELDGPSSWSGGFDHAETLGSLTGLKNIFRGQHGHGVAPLVLDYGAGLLSRLPLRQPASIAFDTSWRDNKGFVIATIASPKLGGRELDVVSVHLDFASASVRTRQLAQLATTLESRTRPLIVLGDFNCSLDEVSCLPKFIERLNLSPHAASISEATFPSHDPTSQIDWILISDELEFRWYRTLDEEFSDHLAIVADVALRAKS